MKNRIIMIALAAVVTGAGLYSVYSLKGGNADYPKSGLVNIAGSGDSVAVNQSGELPVNSPEINSDTIGTIPAADLKKEDAFKIAWAGYLKGDKAIFYRKELMPGQLLKIGDEYVLISIGVVLDPGHSDAGSMTFHYFNFKDGKLILNKKYDDFVTTGSFGQFSEWGVNRKMLDNPVVYVEGGGTFQGTTCVITTLVELAPSGPVTLANIPTYFDDSGYVTDPDKASLYEGKIANVIKDKSFDVVYKGDGAYTVHYEKRGQMFKPKGSAGDIENHC